MLFKILGKDFKRNKVITITLIIFIMLASLLVSSGARIVIELFGAIDKLFELAKTPHFVQMHTGEMDKKEVENYLLSNKLVNKYQIAVMIIIEGDHIYFNQRNKGNINSVMDNGFVKQNPSFDFLLNLKNEIIRVSKGEIAVPIYYMRHQGLEIGDKIIISNGSFDMEFIIADFARDVQMNPSIISSKRFVVSEEDYTILKQNIGDIEYMIEVLLHDIENLSVFTNDYSENNLPQKGPTIDYTLFKTLNALTDGIIAVVIISISILLMMIALLCLRFTLLATIEEDYREIGVMKAIGIIQKSIKKIYLIKYICISGLACIAGFLLSLILSDLFTSNITLYIGESTNRNWNYLIPLLSSCILFLIVILSCTIILRRFSRISAVEALRFGKMGNTKVSTKFIRLKNNRLLNINVFLGINDVLSRGKMYFLLFIIFVICCFIIIVPINFLNTIQSPSFITYMGVGQCDIRIDLQQFQEKDFQNLVAYIKEDNQIKKYSLYTTFKCRVLNNSGILENINIETGDFSKFPLKYLNGRKPEEEYEIALSLLNAKSLEKRIGDILIIEINGKEKEMLVCGTYQDITNGGKTAKALLPNNEKTTLWHTINLDVKENVDIQNVISKYTKQFPYAKVTGLVEYLRQTLGNIVNQVKIITLLAIVIAIFIVTLITALFLKMLIYKDNYIIASMKSIGFNSGHIKIQYIVKTVLVLSVAIVTGALLANTMGQKVVSLLMSFIGAANIKFEINWLVSYVLTPLSLISIVSITTLICTKALEKISITKMFLD